jgi:antitoxin FitA
MISKPSGEFIMSAVTVRKLPEETHAAIKRRAKLNGRSTEAEIRDILVKAVSPDQKVGLGTQLYELGRKYGGIELDIPPRTGAATAHDFGDDHS